MTVGSLWLALLVAAILGLSTGATGGSWQHHHGPILPAFNCKKIAFYKTHKTGSTTLGGVMFRAAVAANRSLYTARSHYLTVGYKESEHLLGRSDVVLRHIRFSEAASWHSATRAFYGRALGTADYGFVTVLRHPVDRYISDFYYYAEPEARNQGNPVTLKQYAGKGLGGNRMAHEFSVRSLEGAVELAASEMVADGLFVPVELLDYAVALLGAHCGWGTASLLYLSVNANAEGAERFGGLTLSSRPDMQQLAAQDPPLLSRISALNTLDAMLYSAALAAFIARLAPGGPAAEAGVLRRAVRLTAARRALGLECKELAGGRGQEGEGGGGVGVGPQGQVGGEWEGGVLAGLCAWYSLSDSVYEKLPKNESGYVTPETRVYGSGTAGEAGGGESWAVGELVAAAARHAAKYDDPSVQYYHMLAGVRVFSPAREEMQLYGSVLGREAAVPLSYRRNALHARWRQMLLEQQAQRSGGSGAGTETSRDDGMAAAAAAVGQAVSGMAAVEAAAAALRLSVARWVVHHVREGFDHLVLCVDQLDMGEREAVRQTVRDILPYGITADAAGNATDASSDGGSGATYDVMECDLPYAAGTGYVQPPHPNDGGDDESGGASAAKPGEGRRGAYAQVAQRARWSTFLTSPTHFMTATRGTVRSVMLWAEAGMAKAGAVCAPTVLWRLGSPYGSLEPGEGGRGGEDEGGSEEGHGEREGAWRPGGVEGGPKYGISRTRVRRRRYTGAGMLGPGGGSSGGGGDGGGFWGVQQQQQQQGSVGHARVLADGPGTETGAANSTQPHHLHPDQLCLPKPCTLVARSPAPCVMVRAMPLLGHTRVYDSEGEALVSERGGGQAAAASASYRVSYKGQEGHRLEVLRLLPTAPEVLAAREADTCSRLARPRVLLPWCEG